MLYQIRDNYYLDIELYRDLSGENYRASLSFHSSERGFNYGISRQDALLNLKNDFIHYTKLIDDCLNNKEITHDDA
jgi:hypothetical protein